MDIESLLEKIDLSQKALNSLKRVILCRPQLDKTNKLITIKIINNHFLDTDVIEELILKLSDYLKLPVKLTFKITDQEINSSEIRNYIKYYNKKNDTTLNLIPVIEDDKIYINLDDKKTFNSLKKFLNNLGIKKEILIKNQETIVETEKIITSDINSSFKTTSGKYRSKFNGNKDDYLYVAMNKITASNNKICCKGKVFSVELRNLKSKKGSMFTIEKFIVTDFYDAVIVKRFVSDSMNENIKMPVEEGMCVAIYGEVKYDMYEKCNVFELDFIEKMNHDPFVRFDDYPGLKHVELHAHTNRSEYDGVSETEEIVTQAFNFGQKAIAITDNSVVQAYPLAQQTHKKIEKDNQNNDFKIIYGIDVKVVPDKLNIVYNPTDELLTDKEYCVLDLETTGLSTKYDHIIEFGGVIVSKNTITNESLQLFVKPPIELPAFIVNKTNITNEMLKGALPIEKAIDKIVDFIGDRVIVAHNADFDFNFINDTLIKLGRKPLKNICLDTLNLARETVKDRKYYRLGVIANYFDVEYDETIAHRADYDAEVLANVLVRMLPIIPDFENMTFKRLQDEQEKDIFKKARPYSVTLLAKNMAGIKDIYELVTLSHTDYLTYYAKENAKKIDADVSAEPRITKSEIEKRRKNILIGSCDQYSELFEIACNRSLADLEQCMKFYDYIELHPLENYEYLIEIGSSFDMERIKMVVKDIIKIADKLNKPIIASSNPYYTHPYQKIARDIYIMGKRIGGLRHPMYPMNREKRKLFNSPNQHLMTTKELLEKFAWTNREVEFVITNTNMIADMINKEYPIPSKLVTPTIEGCEIVLKEEIYKNANNIYGDILPEIVSERIEKELNNVINNGYAVQYYIAHLLVKQSEEDGYPVGSRGSVGSSFIATMANITEVNPLVPHYVCPKCKYSHFYTNNEYANGFDLPEKECPNCSTLLNRNGHNIPFETFLGFDCDKVPDIDLNFSAEYQGIAMQKIKDIFGSSHTYRAGTIGTVAQKTAYGYVKAYCEEMEIPYFSNAFSEVLSKMCEGVKRTTGQHPGGIVVIPKEKNVHDFTPIQYPANNPFSEWQTTHFAFADLHDNILKLDILAHVDPTSIRLLSMFSGVHYNDVPMSDPKTYQLFYSTDSLNISDSDNMYHELNGAAGLPEFGTRNNRRILDKTKPSTFNELVAIEGVTHGTDVWANNAEVLIEEGVCTLNDVISCRDDIMTYLITKGLKKITAFEIMESVRRGRGLKDQWIKTMKEHDVPDWYINSCLLIKYMFPKAHAVAYAMNAVRVGWYKVHKPAAYYAVYFSCRCDAYDIETMLQGKVAIYNRLKEIEDRIAVGEKVSKREEDLVIVLEIALEMYLRGYHFNNICIDKSEAINFIIDPDDEFGIIPSFDSIDGLGAAVAYSIVEQRAIQDFISKEDLLKRTSINNTQMAFLERMGVLDHLEEENQLSLF
ncbi:MAG: PolC-type DNA polymerase III [Erysipelotrichia bacterium]|nr:PolC-type DNA polymerase III [Erysipelotrichia bacterium]